MSIVDSEPVDPSKRKTQVQGELDKLKAGLENLDKILKGFEDQMLNVLSNTPVSSDKAETEVSQELVPLAHEIRVCFELVEVLRHRVGSMSQRLEA